MNRRKNSLLRYSWGDRIFLAIVYGTLILVTLICLYPLFFTVIASVSDAYAVYRGEISFWPKGFTLEAYQMVLENKSIWRGYANTIIYTLTGTMLSLFLTIPVAYALSKRQMYGQKILMTVFLITMYFSGGIIPSYILMNQLKLVNTPWVIILSGGLSVYNLIVTRTFFQGNIPESLYEAARIDGASEFRIFVQVALPLSKAILAVMALYYGVARWNSYFNAMIYLQDKDLFPLQLILRSILILNENAFTAALESDIDAAILADLAHKSYLVTTMKYALVFIASAPMLMIYPKIQKYFVKGVMVGSVKG